MTRASALLVATLVVWISPDRVALSATTTDVFTAFHTRCVEPMRSSLAPRTADMSPLHEAVVAELLGAEATDEYTGWISRPAAFVLLIHTSQKNCQILASVEQWAFLRVLKRDAVVEGFRFSQDLNELDPTKEVPRVSVFGSMPLSGGGFLQLTHSHINTNTRKTALLLATIVGETAASCALFPEKCGS
ncbi:MAG: hypothetical protein AAF631_09340 [Pseudomonadota bacterium]